MIFSAVLTTLCMDFHSMALQAPDQTEMQLVRMVSTDLCRRLEWERVDAFSSCCAECLHCLALLTIVPVCSIRFKKSVICNPRNLVLLTISTAELLMVRGMWLVPPEVHNDLLCFGDVQDRIVHFTPVVSPSLWRPAH